MSDSHLCEWLGCSASFNDPELLYNHLCNDHIGRKSTNNLCLSCKWKDCGTSCAKRDHITSHLRGTPLLSSPPSLTPPPVHTPLKPHVCEVASLSLSLVSRSPHQDLQKVFQASPGPQKARKDPHRRTPCPAQALKGHHRKRPPLRLPCPRRPALHKGTLNKSLSIKPAAAPAHPAPPRSRPHSVSLSHGPSPSRLLSPVSPPPADASDLDHHASRHLHPSAYDLFLQNQVPSWDKSQTLRNKRPCDHAVDDFFADVKKRKVNPAYNPQMAERLNDIVYAHNVNQIDFNPRSVSFDVRSPEELAAVNEFLITLGRDVTGSANRAGSQERFSPSSYFDQDSLNQLGLVGMPGLTSPQSFSQDAYHYSPTAYPSPPVSLHKSSQQPAHYPYSSMAAPYPADRISRPVSPSSSHDYVIPPSYTHSTHHTASPQSHYSPPPLDPTSPHSSSSTPSNATPPHHSSLSDSLSHFDYIRVPRGVPPPIALGAPDYMRKPIHTAITQLQTAPASLRDLPEPNPAAYRGPPANLSALAPAPSSIPSTSSRTLYPHIDDDLKLPPFKPDAGPFRLPPITEMYRSPSPVSTPRSPATSRETTPSSTRSSPVPAHNSLSSLHSATKPSENDELASKVDKIELAHLHKETFLEERTRHAELIRHLLIKINQDYKKRFGTPKLESPKSFTRNLSVDVEMAAA
ncbi:hypothetical protein JVU11DRAFT_4973 [Chiua virens]|nr:hypothetical protein JVU11DRAFT_4973 [Chiua virens]